MCTAVYTYLNSSQGEWDLLVMIPYIVVGNALILAGILNILVKLIAGGWGSPILMDDSMNYSDAIKK